MFRAPGAASGVGGCPRHAPIAERRCAASPLTPRGAGTRSRPRRAPGSPAPPDAGPPALSPADLHARPSGPRPGRDSGPGYPSTRNSDARRRLDPALHGGRPATSKDRRPTPALRGRPLGHEPRGTTGPRTRLPLIERRSRGEKAVRHRRRAPRPSNDAAVGRSLSGWRRHSNSPRRATTVSAPTPRSHASGLWLHCGSPATHTAGGAPPAPADPLRRRSQAATGSDHHAVALKRLWRCDGPRSGPAPNARPLTEHRRTFRKVRRTHAPPAAPITAAQAVAAAEEEPTRLTRRAHRRGHTTDRPFGCRAGARATSPAAPFRLAPSEAPGPAGGGRCLPGPLRAAGPGSRGAHHPWIRRPLRLCSRGSSIP